MRLRPADREYKWALGREFTVAQRMLGLIFLMSLSLPATYSGKIPCADCAGQRMVLTLFPDYTFRMRRTYVGVNGGEDKDFYELGRWTRVQDDANRLRFVSGPNEIQQYRLVGKDRLRMLDRKEKEISSKLNYDLIRQAEVDPVAGPMWLRGMYRHEADSASFIECRTGKRFLIAMDSHGVELKRAYQAQGTAPGEPVLATFTGRFESNQLFIVQFENFWPGTTCGREPKGAQTVTVGRSGILDFERIRSAA